MRNNYKKKILIIIIIFVLTILYLKNIKERTVQPNAPELVNGMIPVNYNSEKEVWIKADKTNDNKSWYDYENKKWANVIVVEKNKFKEKYEKAKTGTEILVDDILAFYVWIPRYKYRVFNINKKPNYDFYNAKKIGIDIKFEKEKQTTGTIKCNYYHVNKLFNNNEICTGNNGMWYTHPAFTFGNNQLAGLWVGKFETTGTAETPTILPDINALTNQKITQQFETAQVFKTYTDNQEKNVDAHMMKNLEWGAVAYLSHSKYGRCTNYSCSEIKINNNESFITGTTKSSNDIYYLYNSLSSANTSTTGNIYGIYDMNGGAQENVLANISKTENGYTFNDIGYNNFSNQWYKNNYKYIDTYAYSESIYDHKNNYKTKLGDAMGETFNWYDDYKIFANNEQPWIERGGNYSMGKTAGIFAFSGNMGYNTRMNGFRSVLVKY